MKVLVISAHPDDETLGCGGTLLKHAAQGDTLSWIIVTEAHEPEWKAKIIQRMAGQVNRVAETYEMKECFKLGFPTTRLDTVPLVDVMEQFREKVVEIKPEVVYLVHGGDVHTDHQTVFTAVTSVLKPLNMELLGVRKILCYETLSSTEAAPTRIEQAFLPNVLSDISPYIDQKIDIMGLYESEIQPKPLPRESSAIRALARFRGASMGVDYAEAFMLVRELA